MTDNLQKKFIEYIGDFFDKVEAIHKNETYSLEAQKEIYKNNLKSLMILIHRQYVHGNISEETYKTACLIYSMGRRETFDLEKD
jgi:hypothetical protein